MRTEKERIPSVLPKAISEKYMTMGKEKNKRRRVEADKGTGGRRRGHELGKGKKKR